LNIYFKWFVKIFKHSKVSIKDDTTPAFQVRRYGYYAKLPLSILTDFEEFAVYDTRIKPNKNDRASVARIFYCTYDEYLKPNKSNKSRVRQRFLVRRSFNIGGSVGGPVHRSFKVGGRIVPKANTT
jgi:hypothetical protein